MPPYKNDMQLSERGKDLIKSFEGLRLRAYKPTPNDVWTIGYGHTKNVQQTDTITRQQADAYFDMDTAWAVETVNKRATVKLTQAMFDALVSIVYNCGSGVLAGRVGIALNKEQYNIACRNFMLWNKQNGKVLPGLTRRREAEMALFMADGLPE